MALQEQTRTIGDLTFTVRQLPAMKSARLLARIGRLIGPALASGARDLKGTAGKGTTLADFGKLDVSVFLGGAAGAIESLCERLSEDEMEGLIRALLASTLVHPTSEEQAAAGARPLTPRELMPVFDHLMQGRMSELFQLLGFAFEVQYGNFFGALGGIVGPYLTKTAEPSKSESPST